MLFLFFSNIGYDYYCYYLIRNNTGEISSQLRGSDKECSWFITTSPGTFIRLSFSQLNFSAPGEDCGNYFLSAKLHVPYDLELDYAWYGSKQVAVERTHYVDQQDLFPER